MAINLSKPVSTFHPRVNGYSPWGSLISVERLADGIYRVSSASHGGIWLNRERQKQMQEEAPHLLDAVMRKSYAPKPAWWEEDCEAVLPLLAFWDDLPAAMRRDEYYKNMVQTANYTYALTLTEEI